MARKSPRKPRASRPAARGKTKTARRVAARKRAEPPKRPRNRLAEALDRMGLQWPTTTKQVATRFAQLSDRRSGVDSNQQMRMLLQDRSLILSAIAATSG